MSQDLHYTRVIDNFKKISASLDYLYLEEIHLLEDMLKDNKYKVAVIGEFSVGKSTFLNSLIGKRILYSSAKEATGVVTFIENSEEEVAEILYNDEKIDTITLKDEESYSKLIEFMDKNSSIDNIKAINIKYPFDGFDKEVIFLDTPGLQGISLEQTLITKNILKEANATIIIINHKGLTKTELDLLKGNNKEFGRIKTKEVIVVINRIGEIYENRTKEEAEEKINQLVNEVKDELKKNEIEVNNIFAVDSKDYLWSKDSKLYKEVLDNNDNEIKTILSQEEYLKRSKFIKFKEYLLSFLDKSNRQEKLLEDINDKFLALTELFKDDIEKKLNSESYKLNSKVEKARVQKELMLYNQRKLYNTMIRQLSKSSEELYKAIENDLKNIKDSQMKELSLDISKIKRAIHLNEKSRKVLNGKVESFIKKEIENTNNKLNKYYSYINDILEDSFEKEFKKLFNEDSNLRLKSNLENVNIDFTFKNQQNEDYDLLDILKEEIFMANQEKEKLEKEYLSLKEVNPEEQYSQLKQEFQKIKIMYQEEKRNLGRKPRPEQKYKQVTRTKRKCILFKEEYEVRIPDGLDYSKCNEWDVKNKKLEEKYKNKEDELYYKLDQIEYSRKKLKRIYLRKIEIDRNLDSLKSQYEISNMKREEINKRNEEYFVNAKKNEIYVCLEKTLNNYYKVLLHHVLSIIEDREKKIKESINKDSNEYLHEYEEKLNFSIENIISQLDTVKVDERDALESLKQIELELQRG